jgi:hypothetical protein
MNLKKRIAFARTLRAVLFGAFLVSLFAGAAHAAVHGLWVWKSATVLEAPRGAEALLEFCKSEDINEVYLSISARSEAAGEGQLAHVIAALHRSDIRVEALLDRKSTRLNSSHARSL